MSLTHEQRGTKKKSGEEVSVLAASLLDFALAARLRVLPGACFCPNASLLAG